MRIVFVSAHFPPNFVSGGTLQPQRLAQGLRAKGHDVSVYAGWLGSRPPLDSWEEPDDTGMPVRWVSTGRWIGWSDRRNWDNPPVDAHFAAYLRERRPEIVHLHSLQSLGAGMVGVAARSGAKVVVTMHDFWWCCARQFLVDRNLTPCPLVVAAGSCACEVSADWLQERNRRLVEMLAPADLILAPSVVAASVLAANGLDHGRLRVDENGAPELEPSTSADMAPFGEPPPHSADDANVRFLYTGGGNALKGVDVLFRAARRLVNVAGWHLAAYGAGDRNDAGGEPGGRPPGVDGLPVDVLPPFDPAEIEAVYGAADVLVVPSLMRESHSLVTREALTRGLPVVCTDTLGPEEVVTDGHNGLVVAAGDHLALADAMRRLVQEPDLLARVRRGAVENIAVRSLTDQVDGLEKSYGELLARPGMSAPAPPSIAAGEVRRVLFVCGIEGAPLRYRARLPAEALGLYGVHVDVRHYRHPEVGPLAARADALVAYRVPATVQVLRLLEQTRSRGTPVLFDVDDLIFDPELTAEIPALSLLPKEEAELWLDGVRRYRTTMESCDAFVGSTDSLCGHAAAVTGLPTHRFANGVGILLGRLSDQAVRRARAGGPPRMGYLSGTNTHDHDWAFIEPAVVEILERHRGVQLWMGGQVKTSAALDPFEDRIVRLPLLPWTRLPGVLADLDVNLAPLAPGSRFNDAKSAIKWLEAALTSTATVASPTEPFQEAITHASTGLLAGGVDDWVESIESLLVDENLREAVGRRARREALLRWSPFLQGRRYLDILDIEMAGAGGPRRTSTWAPVAHDEPPERVELEPYDAPAGGAGPVSGPMTALERSRSGAQMVRRKAADAVVLARAGLAGRTR